MGRPKNLALTRQELQIMQAVWHLGPSTVTEVRKALSQELAYTTVQTMLNILERKGRLKRERRGRAFVYSASVTRTQAARLMLTDLLDRMFGGSGEELVMSLLETRHLDVEQLEELTDRYQREQEKTS